MKKNTNYTAVILIFIIAGIILYYIFGVNSGTIQFRNKKERISGLTYNGQIKFDTTKEIKLTLPSTFTDTSSGYAKTGYYTNGGGFIQSCRFEIMYTTWYDNASNLAQGVANFFKTTPNEVENNGIKWQYVFAKTTPIKDYYFADYKNGIVYLKYDRIITECSDLAPEILKGISF